MNSPIVDNLHQWNDFFVMVGGGAAALAGLVFVAMSINLQAIVGDATHRNRAVGTLSGFTAVFILCGLTLMGNQTNLTIGAEWLFTSAIAGSIYVYGYFQAARGGGSQKGLSRTRTAFGTISYVAQIAGAAMLMAGDIRGMYLAAVAMMFFFCSLVSGAWLLLVGICSKDID